MVLQEKRMRLLSKPVTKSFNLTNDPDQIAKITVKQLTVGAVHDLQAARLDFTERRIYETPDGGKAVFETGGQDPRLKVRFLWLSLADATGFYVDEDNTELLKFKERDGVMVCDMGIDEFARAIAKVTPEVYEEMFECALEVNPNFGTILGE
jgi:hypothetical protein